MSDALIGRALMQVDLLKGNVGAKFRSEMRSVEGSANSSSKGIAGALSGAMGMVKVAAVGGAIALVGAGVASVKAAADFQESMTSLVTGAGEAKSNIGLVSKGILDMAGQVGVSAEDLAAGMYMVESAGFHGAQGLSVLRAAAEGAKVGNADMATVANAVTSALNAYGLSGDHATAVTNDLVATVAAGKMHMQDLAGSLGTILPEAASLHLGLADVSGAIATMTMQGTDAFTATQGLRFLLTSLVKTTPAASAEMKKFGLASADVATELTTKGLQPTLETITDAVGKRFPVGSAEYLQAVATMVGGTRGLNTTLELTGTHMATYKSNIDSIGTAAKQGGKDVAGWDEVQGDFNVRLEQAQAGAGAFGIQIGTRLLPYVSALLGAFVANLPAIESFADQLVTVAIQIGTQVAPAVQFAGQVLGVLAAHGEIVKVALLGIAAAFAVFQIGQFVGMILLVVNAFRAMAIQEGIMAAVNLVLGTSELFAFWPLLLLAAAIAAVIVVGYLLVTHWKQVSALAREVGTVVGGALARAWTTASAAVTHFAMNVWETVSTFFLRLQARVESAWAAFAARPAYWIGVLVAYVPLKLLELTASFQNWVEDMIVKAIEWGLRMVWSAAEASDRFQRAIEDELQRLPGQVWSWLSAVFPRVLAWDEQLSSNARTAAMHFAQSLLDEWNALPGQVWSIGQQIVMGIINGVGSLQNWAQGQVANFAQGLLQGAKSALGISSPSRAFERQVGEPSMEGIPKGFGNRFEAAKSSISRMVAELVPPAPAQPAVGAATAPATGPARGDELTTLVAQMEQEMRDVRDILRRLDDGGVRLNLQLRGTGGQKAVGVDVGKMLLTS